jgi:two-component system nitrogen regulation sensor histidine kinase GlnL
VELWREIFDNLSDAVIALGAADEPLAVNAAGEAMLEASRVGRSLVARLLKRNQWLRRMVDDCLSNGQTFDNPEATLMLERRSLVVRAEVSPLIDSSGGLAGAILLFHDLSHQKSAEQAFEMGENVLRLSPAGLAHEVKNPLTGIKGAAELLGAMFPGDARAQQYCGLIQDGVNRIAALVEQVLAVSNPQRLKRVPVNIHQVLHQALRIAGIFPGENHTGLGDVAIEQQFDPSLPEVHGDAAALERVFLNLIRNACEAVEAMRRNGPAVRPSIAPAATETAASGPNKARGIIRLRTAIETQFRLSSHGRRRQYLRVEIADNGKGMREDEIKQLFTPFFTTKPSGTGLGLVLSQRIIALHGGKLWAERGGIDRRTEGALAATPTTHGRPRDGVGAHSERAARAVAPGMTFCLTLPIGPE